MDTDFCDHRCTQFPLGSKYLPILISQHNLNSHLNIFSETKMCIIICLMKIKMEFFIEAHYTKYYAN